MLVDHQKWFQWPMCSADYAGFWEEFFCITVQLSNIWLLYLMRISVHIYIAQPEAAFWLVFFPARYVGCWTTCYQLSRKKEKIPRVL